jgi:translation initiation factor IF-2
MSQEILNSVLAIESEAKALKEKFEEQLSQTNAATDQRVNEAKSNMEQSLEVYKAELKEKNQQKKAEFEAKVKEDELAEIAALKERFNHLKQDLVQDTVKEVLKRYGNS